MSNKTDKPTFAHDCNSCTFLGTYTSADGNPCDLYHCVIQRGGPTVIARYSSTLSDYVSGLHSAHALPDLQEALRRAKERHLMTSRPVT
jgi:hypothetical protein